MCSDEESVEVTKSSSFSTNTQQLFTNKWSRRSFNIKEHLTKIMQRSQTYQVNSTPRSEEDDILEDLPVKTSTKRHSAAFQSDTSPLKITKKQGEEIRETPTCRRTSRRFVHGKPFSEFAHRVKIKPQSVRLVSRVIVRYLLLIINMRLLLLQLRITSYHSSLTL